LRERQKVEGETTKPGSSYREEKRGMTGSLKRGTASSKEKFRREGDGKRGVNAAQTEKG